MTEVKDVDHGYQALVKRVFGLEGKPKIQVGIFEAAGAKSYEDAVTVLEVAIWNEFGTDTIPERSFIRAWFDENEEKCREAVRRMLVAVLEGKYQPEQALELVAQRFVGEIQKRMALGIPPPNSPATVARKGSATPLIDTGQLRSSVTYRVYGAKKKDPGP
jgi:hypothetical protein